MSVPERHRHFAPLAPGQAAGSVLGVRPHAAILESLDDGLIIAGPDGRVTFHNPAATRLLGVTGTLLAGENLREVLLRLGVRPVPATHPATMHITAIVAGRRRNLRLRTFRVRDAGGATLGVGHLVEDITSPRHVLRHRDLELDADTMRASLAGRRLDLTRTELTLLRYFMENAGTTLRHAWILRQVWGPKYRDEAHYVRVYVSRLRQKIEPDPAHPTYLVTERGIGYRFVVG